MSLTLNAKRSLLTTLFFMTFYTASFLLTLIANDQRSKKNLYDEMDDAYDGLCLFQPCLCR